MPSPPRVFISSTFYDLRHLRDALASFLQADLGYQPVLSEHSSFPVDPDADTVENCRRRVQQDADIFVLVVGSRYGSIPFAQDRSVTNIEYLTAKAAGLPCYVFVLSEILHLLPTWQVNPSADFQNVVDTPALFAFVDTIRRTDARWVFSFATPSDIIDALRVQLAYLMARGLTLLRRTLDPDPALASLHGRSFRLAVERPLAWQGRLFAEVIRRGVTENEDAYSAHSLGVAFGPGETVLDGDMPDWFQACFAQALRLTEGFSAVINTLLAAAINTDEAAVIAGSARQVVAAYADALAWSARVRRAHIPSDWEEVRRQVARMTDQMIDTVRDFPSAFTDVLDAFIGKVDGPTATLSYTITITVPNQADFQAALDALARRRGLY